MDEPVSPRGFYACGFCEGDLVEWDGRQWTLAGFGVTMRGAKLADLERREAGRIQRACLIETGQLKLIRKAEGT